MKNDTTALNVSAEPTEETNLEVKDVITTKPFWAFLKGLNFGKGTDISEKTAATLVTHTQSSLTEIHENTVQATTDMVARSAEAISTIGVAHESKASEAIDAIAKLASSGQQSSHQGLQTASKGVLNSAILIIGLVGGAIGIISSTKK
ncbi:MULTISPECIES: hypothetical protein [Enterobacteriaceae]|uniref:hypothetical protein n=1 Tax=Enterobacteriaceae TaxID=543 RepID=UPI0028A895F3|nr:MULTISPECIES: hypothetical protein [Enterobacteriaceae]MEB7559166.1 hypothetical protein [Kluyvera cryocrescens]